MTTAWHEGYLRATRHTMEPVASWVRLSCNRVIIYLENYLNISIPFLMLMKYQSLFLYIDILLP